LNSNARGASLGGENRTERRTPTGPRKKERAEAPELRLGVVGVKVARQGGPKG